MADSQLHKVRRSKVGIKVRQKLIKRVIESGYSITSSAKYFKVRLSTAKAIIAKYKKTGYIYDPEKQKEHEIREKTQQVEKKIEQNQDNILQKKQISPINVNPVPYFQEYVVPPVYYLGWNPYIMPYVPYGNFMPY